MPSDKTFPILLLQNQPVDHPICCNAVCLFPAFAS